MIPLPKITPAPGLVLQEDIPDGFAEQLRQRLAQGDSEGWEYQITKVEKRPDGNYDVAFVAVRR